MVTPGRLAPVSSLTKPCTDASDWAAAVPVDGEGEGEHRGGESTCPPSTIEWMMQESLFVLSRIYGAMLLHGSFAGWGWPGSARADSPANYPPSAPRTRTLFLIMFDM